MRDVRVGEPAPRALVCAPSVPEFDRASGSQRTLDLLDFLRGAGWAVTFLAQHAIRGTRYADALQQRGVAVYVGFERHLDRLLAAARFQVALVCYWTTAEACLGTIRRLSPATRVVVDSVDLHFLRDARQRELQAEGRGNGLDPARVTAWMREVRVYAAADAVWTVSPREAELVTEVTGDRTLSDTVPDCEDIPVSRRPYAQRRGILFIGNFRHLPNIDAVDRLCRGILPHLDRRLRAEHPLFVVGHGPTPEVLRWSEEPGVHVVGWVPSLLPYLERVRVAVAPLSWGAGTKRKVIQALMAGTPVVSTRMGTEGLPLEDGRHVLLADDDEAMARALAGVLGDPLLWGRLASQGREAVASVHGREAVRARFRQALARALARTPREAGGVSGHHASVGSFVQGPDLAAMLRTGTGRQGSRPDAVIFSGARWAARFCRSQQLALCLAANGHRVVYVEPPAPDRPGMDRPGVMSAGAANVVVVDPLPGARGDLHRDGLDDARAAEVVATLNRLRDLLGIHEAFVKVDAPAWYPAAAELSRRHGWPMVYDRGEERADAGGRLGSVARCQQALLRDSALVIAASEPLARAARRAGASSLLLLPDATDPEHFGQPTLPPRELWRLPRPIVGYVGEIDERFDVAMVAEAARLRPKWTFLLIGPVLDADVSALARLSNVILHGTPPVQRLPASVQVFDVACLPHRRRPHTHRAGGLELFAYLSLGQPVVASRLEWLAPYGRQGLLAFADDGAGLVRQAERALRRATPAAQRRRRWARRHTWQRRYEAVWPRLVGIFPRVSLIVVTFDNLACTRRCLESVFACTAHPNYEVIVVDNGSTDATVRYLRGLQRVERRLRVLVNRRNEGFARAANRGLAAATGDVLVLLNNDVVVTPGWLGALLGALREPGVGAVGPTTNFAGNEAQVDVGYQTLDGLGAFAGRFTALHATERLSVDRLSMFCLAMPRAVWEGVGPLDERFEIGMFEDDDYARRIRLTGRDLSCVSNAFVHHVGHAAFRKLGDGTYERLFEANRRRYEEKWQTTWRQASRRQSPDSGG